jgi:hypothetical protein
MTQRRIEWCRPWLCGWEAARRGYAVIRPTGPALFQTEQEGTVTILPTSFVRDTCTFKKRKHNNVASVFLLSPISRRALEPTGPRIYPVNTGGSFTWAHNGLNEELGHSPSPRAEG